MSQSHTFQSIILKLQEYWAARGCLIWQPYYTQVGAGTMNPATFLRVLGPEPWDVAYVEPSVRPDDGRYGENPNRFQVHYQYQVILKPDPGNPQELYIDSLKALGIDPRQHDIRFVEDNWEQPAISAWGLGWEVWLDGQEITQFTYFQQVGGLALDPVAVEITYGLERILIALNGASAIWDEPWNERVSYGEIRRREAFEHSRYYFEIADIERVRQMYELFEAEAKAALEEGVILPAYDYVLKCSHTFNILDTRGAVSVAERQAYFRRMRALARRVAEAYVAQREALGFPLLPESSPTPSPRVSSPPTSQPSRPADFLLEIGTEELPPSDVETALSQLRERVPALLDDLRLEHGEVRVYGTPRRLTIAVAALAPRQADVEQVVKGPPAERAFDADGRPTRAAEGFARSKGVDVESLEVREVNGGRYVVAVVRQVGRPAPQVLAETLPDLIASLHFGKSMRWNDSGVAFSRPIRWLVALFGEEVIPFVYAGVASGRTTRGLRPEGSPEIEVPSAEAYFDALRQAGVVLDPQARRQEIRTRVTQLAESVGGQALIEEDLLSEVTHLVEKPTPLLGSFDEEFLALPREVLIAVMKKHQRYFPVLAKAESGRGEGAKDGSLALLPYFIAIRNGDEQYLDIVRQGNEHVLNARFADAHYFVREDLKQPLEAYRPKLAALTFHTRLGSMLDKSERMLSLSSVLGKMLGLDKNQLATLERATLLAKADLVTQMVTEMTSLQGVMGREYALRGGESPEVATAIEEQYRMVPETRVGLALALTDRIDSLVGLFAAGLAPSGAKDPFGLRRAALGIVQPLIEHDLDFALGEAVRQAAALQPIDVSEETQRRVLEFIAGRLAVLLKEKGYRYDVVEAVLAERADNPAAAARAVKRLQAWVEREDWHDILPAYARCVRILRAAKVRPGALPAVDESLLREEAEKSLHAALRAIVKSRPATVDELLEIVISLLPAINRFFDDVLVMAEDESLRTNRLALVGQVAALAEGIADLSKLEGF